MPQPVLKAVFGTPHHGWLPVGFEHASTRVEFNASDVPNNPVDDLIAGLERMAEGSADSFEVYWHLEPQWYVLTIQTHAQWVDITLEGPGQPDDANGLRCRLQRQECLVVLWRALRRLEALKPDEPHWPLTDFARLTRIKQLLDATRVATQR